MVDPQHTVGSRLWFFAHVDTTNSDLGVPHKGIQFAFQLVLLLLHGTLHTVQTGEDIFNLAFGGMYLLLRLVDPIQHCPVSKQAIKEVIGKPQEAVHIDLHIGTDPHVGQFRLKTTQLGLQVLDVTLCLIQMAVLGKVGDQATAKEIPCTPALGTI